MRWKTVFFGLAAVAIVAGVAWALLGSRLLVVRSVQVTGTGPQVSRAQVLAAARIPAGLPLIRVNTAAVAQRVERDPAGAVRAGQQELAVHGRDLGPAPHPGLRGRGAAAGTRWWTPTAWTCGTRRAARRDCPCSS